MSFNITRYPTLALVGSTQELRLSPKESLSKLCDKLRHCLLDNVNRSSGHFASGLGTVELAVALHYVYSTLFDQLIWDVGYQAYPREILTGRRGKIGTIRQKGGLHPFPWRGESEYSVLGVGHPSTSISAGIGTAVAAEKEGKNRHTVYIIGDGATTAGMAFEAINHAGDVRPDMLVVLDGNEMPISENVDALNNHLAQLLSGKPCSSLREGGEKVFSGVPPIEELLKHTEEHIEGVVVPGTLSEELGFNYIGLVDDHDVLGLVTTLKNMCDLRDPQFLYIMIKESRSCEPAKKGPITFHAVPKFNPSSDCLPKSSDGLPGCSKIFGNWLYETAAKGNKLMAITPAMREGPGMVEFSRRFPDRYFDVAIAEQHTVIFAAGLTIGGYKPTVAIYSTFLQHAYDQVLHDVTIQKPSVPFAANRAGIAGADGQAHQSAFDLSYLRCIPGMVIMIPSDEGRCRQMLYTGYHYNDGPSAMHYPRDNTVGVELTPLEKLPISKDIVRCRSGKLAILNFGTLMSEAAKVAESLNAMLVDMRFVKPLDKALILEIAANHEALAIVEENAIMGDAGSKVNEVLMAYREPILVPNTSLSGFFVPQGIQEEMRVELGLDAADMEAKIKTWLA